MVSLVSLFGLFLLNAHAESYIELKGSQLKCEKISTSIFHCGSTNHRVLVLKKNQANLVIEQKESSTPMVSLATKLIDNNVTVFDNAIFSNFSKEKILSKTERIENAKNVISLLKDVNDPWAIEFIRESEKNIQKLLPTSPRKVEIKTNSGEVFSCQQGQLKKEFEKINSQKGNYGFLATCDYYTCNSKNQNQVLAFIPSPRSLYRDAHFFKVNGEKTELHSSDFKIFDSNFSDDHPFFDIPKSNQLKPEQSLFVPKKYQTNSNAFEYLTNVDRANSFIEKEKYCEGNTDLLNLLKEKNSVTQTMIKDLEESELVQYLSMTDGKIISLIANANRVSEIGCKYEDMILSPAAWENVRYLQNLKLKKEEKYLTPTEVQELFIKASKMSDIPFNYKEEGCYARAHLMARRFEKMGIPTEKVWIKGSLTVPGTDIGWNFHVAPVVSVKNEKGEIKKYVIDPSLTNNAVLLDDWIKKMGKIEKGDVVKTTYPFPSNVKDVQRVVVGISSSDVFLPQYDQYMTEEDKMKKTMDALKEMKKRLRNKK